MEKLSKICIVGPPRSEKTSLAKALSHHYKTYYAPDYEKEYLEMTGREPEERDRLNIAKGQLNLEREYSAMAENILICDTCLLSKKWDYFFHENSETDWFDKKLKNNHYHLLILIPPSEESSNRKSLELFEFMKEQAEKSNLSFIIISSDEKEERLKNAINATEKVLGE